MMDEPLLYRIEHRPYHRYALLSMSLSIILFLGYSLSSFTSLAVMATCGVGVACVLFAFKSHYHFSDQGIREYRLYRIHHMHWNDVTYTQWDPRGALILHTKTYTMVIVPYLCWIGPECRSALSFLKAHIDHIDTSRCSSIIRYTLWPF